MTYDWAMIRQDIKELYVVRKYKAEDVLVFLRQHRSLNIKLVGLQISRLNLLFSNRPIEIAHYVKS